MVHNFYFSSNSSSWEVVNSAPMAVGVFNWGANYFPVGLGVQGGANIPFSSGTYTIIINDMDETLYLSTVIYTGYF